MGSIPLLTWLLVLFYIAESFATGSNDGIHLPLIRRETAPSLRRRAGTAAIGLGDYYDVAYNIMVKVGDVLTPVILDTGSSDLWVISDACKTCVTDLPLYPESSFKSAGLNVELLYGDSSTGTRADGEIGSDTVSLAGLSLSNQYFAAITDTNTSVLDVGSTGIFGLGFPINSFIWSKLFKQQQSSTSGSARRDADVPSTPEWRRGNDFRRTKFPDIAGLYAAAQSKEKRQTTDAQLTDLVLSTYLKDGTLLSRLVQQSALTSPMYSITLQRDSFQIGGNTGMLSLGSLPPGVDNSSVTWVPLRPYTVADGGLAGPTFSPNEEYPLTWEIPLDDVYFDGKKLPRSSLSSSSISLSALVDTGNSLIRGPSDLVNTIYETLNSDSKGVIPCSTPHTLGFSIGGKMFNVDPRDFVSQAYEDDTEDCVPNLVATDSPVQGEGYLFSWSLGDPFLKSVMSAYYFGNITQPSLDPPRMGFLSTVPQDANAQYSAVVAEASGKTAYAFTVESAPTGTPTAASTDSNGVGVAATATVSRSASGGSTGGSSDGSNQGNAATMTSASVVMVGAILGAGIMMLQL